MSDPLFEQKESTVGVVANSFIEKVKESFNSHTSRRFKLFAHKIPIKRRTQLFWVIMATIFTFIINLFEVFFFSRFTRYYSVFIFCLKMVLAYYFFFSSTSEASNDSLFQTMYYVGIALVSIFGIVGYWAAWNLFKACFTPRIFFLFQFIILITTIVDLVALPIVCVYSVRMYIGVLQIKGRWA
ncbi:hypothetical protein PCE1_003723 [Barthelona sp. PCE]